MVLTCWRATFLQASHQSVQQVHSHLNCSLPVETCLHSTHPEDMQRLSRTRTPCRNWKIPAQCLNSRKFPFLKLLQNCILQDFKRQLFIIDQIIKKQKAFYSRLYVLLTTCYACITKCRSLHDKLLYTQLH